MSTAEQMAADGALGVREAQEFLGGVSRSHLYELMERGELAYSKIGRRRLLPRAELRRLLAAGMVGTAEAK
jgi:excisionase family DNA binding protein